MHYFDTFIYCNVIAVVAMFIILHNYRTILLSIFTVVYIRLCTLHGAYPCAPH